MVSKFKDRLREIRKYNKITQKQLGNHLKITEQTVSKYETGVSEPNIEMIIEIAKFFNVTIDYLLGNDNFTKTIDSEVSEHISSKNISEDDILRLREILNKLENK